MSDDPATDRRTGGDRATALERWRQAAARRDGPGPHVAARPAWRCRACAAPWPCQPAKLSLRREYAHDRPALSIYLWLLMHDAITDALRVATGPVDPATYFTRFIAWTRHGWPPPGASEER
ncbi:hypothetical protein [Micromonospora sp. HUAS LYJ1]|uniref:hypothetical protein n=1 Tax=Micromonospora sp. HUAS LYJ1 TaxID=3061626 RepID=UPI0026726E6B|nr:hypothetical protein [Micromonospora sp. HUAS LYJ1]WKU04672.1 hypothetical protein Q2K16_28450 [Micromonospora sp. HUAS LYJ1]